jgi:hypothetical protein
MINPSATPTPANYPAIVRATIIRPALMKQGLFSFAAEQLLMGTAAIESNFVNFVQFNQGPARGMFQMEPPTFQDLVTRVLGAAKNHQLQVATLSMSNSNPPAFSQLTTNHLFAAAMARVKYYSIPHPIPMGLIAQANYWWNYYNGRSLHGLKPSDYINAWNKYCAPLYNTGVALSASQ